MDKKFIVYKHMNKINGKNYFGITSQKPSDRWRNHGSDYKGSPRFYRAIQHYGWDGFTHQILIHGLTENQAKRWETRLILFYKSNVEGFGYNLTNGGEYNQMNEESKKKIGIANKYNMENGVREKIKESLKDRDFKGEKNPYYGKHHSPEARKKMSENHWMKKVDHSELYNIRAVIRLKDKKVYYSLKECVRQDKIGWTTLYNHVNHNVKQPRYMYYDEYLAV